MEQLLFTNEKLTPERICTDSWNMRTPVETVTPEFRAFIDQFKRRPYYYFFGGRLNGIAEP